VGNQIMAVGWALTSAVVVRVHVPQLTPFGSASTSPWYGLAARIGTGGGLKDETTIPSCKFRVLRSAGRHVVRADGSAY
jgi:hypothetical protein